MFDAISVHGSFADHASNNILDTESIFSFPAIQPVQNAPANMHPGRAVLMEAATGSTQDARACQVRSRTNSFEHSRHEASRRDFNSSDSAQRSSPSRRRPRRRSPSRKRPLYPDYYTPYYSPRDRPRDCSNDPRVAELFTGICAEERNLSALVSSMTDMDVGRDDRYRGSGSRGGGGGGNKRRRDGKLRATQSYQARLTRTCR